MLIIYNNIIHASDPLVQDPDYGDTIAFYDEPAEEQITSEGLSIDFENGLEVTVPEGSIQSETAFTLKAQPAFASEEVFVLPSGVESASPTYLLTSDSESPVGNMTLKMDHFVKVKSEEDRVNLVFLWAKSVPSKDSKYSFQQVHTGDPQFEMNSKAGTISTNQFGFWKVGKKSEGTVIYCFTISYVYTYM